VLTLIFIIFIIRLVYLPASLFIGFWFAMQLLAAFAGAGAGSGVAFVAHVGGFVAGFVLVKLMGPMRGYRRPGTW
jgi:membrane associated rhomboid family serine protease